MTEIIKIDRGTIVEHLTASTIDHIEMNPYSLEMYLKNGFRGFDNYSDEELIAEYKDYISEDSKSNIEIILED